MPRDGSGIYTLPFPDVVTNTTIESAKENGTLHDFATDANAARPIIAGGTGATSAAQARDQTHLQAERATQTIVNFDADPLEPGSFTAATTALGSPVAGHAFTGIVFGPDANNLFVNAHDQDDTAVPVRVYTRQKKAGVWGSWVLSGGSGAVRYDIAQTLTVPQQDQARKNIYAAPLDLLGDSGLQINGGFEVTQDVPNGATSTFVSGASGHIADQWAFFNALTNTMTANVSAYNIAGAGGIQRIARLSSASAQPAPTANQYVLLQQIIEGYRTARLNWGVGFVEPITVCFLVSGSRAGTAALTIRNGAADRTYVAPFPVTTTLAWQVITVPGDATSGKWLADSGPGIRVAFCFGCGSTFQTSTVNAWQAGNFMGQTGITNFLDASTSNVAIAAVAVIPGNVAPADIYQYANMIMLRSFERELQACKRYFQKSYVYTDNLGIATQGSSVKLLITPYGAGNTGANNAPGPRFEVEMRATPTMRFWNAYTGALGGVKVYDPSHGTNQDCTLTSAVVSSKDFSVAASGGSGWTGGTSLEAQFHFAADARL